MYVARGGGVAAAGYKCAEQEILRSGATQYERVT